MAQNPLTRRLIAAGASPERAQQFTTMAAQRALRAPGVPTPVRQRMPRETGEGSGVNPPTPVREEPIIPPGVRQGATAEVAFDPQIMAIAQAKYPSTWRTPAIESPEAEDYIIGAYGEKTNQDIIDTAFKQYAPNYLKLEKSFNQKFAKGDINPMAYTFNDKLYSWLANDVPLETVKELMAAEAITSPGAFGGLKLDEAQKLADDLYSEYDTANKQAITARQEFLNNDKYWSASIPNPKFKYGATTNLRQGTIGVDTLPNAKNYYQQWTDLAKTSFPGSSAAAGIAVDKLLAAVKKRNGTPFTDEVIRRQDLYKASIVQR
jgi:hypothetical protein